MNFEETAPEPAEEPFPLLSPASVNFVEQLREYVIGQLAEGKTCSEIEDDLIGQGIPSDFAIEFVERIHGVGLGGGGNSGTVTTYLGGAMKEFDEDLSSKRSRLAAARHRRELGRAREAASGPSDPALQQVDAPFSRELFRQRRDHSQLEKWIVAAVVLSTILLSVLLWLLTF